MESEHLKVGIRIRPPINDEKIEDSPVGIENV